MIFLNLKRTTNSFCLQKSGKYCFKRDKIESLQSKIIKIENELRYKNNMQKMNINMNANININLNRNININKNKNMNVDIDINIYA